MNEFYRKDNGNFDCCRKDEKNVKNIYLSTSVLPDKTYFSCDMSLTSEIPDNISIKLDIKILIIIIITNTS